MGDCDWGVEDVEDFLGSVGEEGGEELSDGEELLVEVEQDFFGLFGIGFGNSPRLEVVDVFVELLDFGPDVVESFGVFEVVHELGVFDIGKGGLGAGWESDGVFNAQDGEALDEVAKVVGEFAGVSGVEFFPGKIRVGEGVDVAEEEVAEGVEAVFVDDVERVDDVAEGFGHFLAICEDVTVGEDDFGEWKVEGE